MGDRCPDSFDKALLSAYLDDELTQQEGQRVRLHLEDCSSCRTTFDQLKAIHEATRGTSFSAFSDDQWDEAPRGGASRAFRLAGFGLLIVYALGALYLALRDLGDASTIELIVAIGFLGGGTLLFLSVLIDRLKTYKTDRYRRVQK